MFKEGVEKLKVIEKELEKRGVKNIFFGLVLDFFC